MSTYRVVRTVHHAVRDGRLCMQRVEHQVVEVVAGGPCLAPVPVGAGAEVVLVDCGRRRPASEQCEPCRTHVEVVEVRRIVDTSQPNRADASSGAA